MLINAINTQIEPSFGYKHLLKKLYLKGKIKPEYGIYGDKLTKDNVSLEHILPQSKGGKTELYNLALASKRMNNLRGNQPLQNFLTTENLIRYINQFVNIRIKKFNGEKYVNQLLKTINKVLEMET